MLGLVASVEEAIVPLLGLLRRIDEDGDDWVGEDLPRVMAAIGPATIQPLADYLANPAHGEWARVAAASAIRKVGQSHPEARAECVARLGAQLERFAGQSETLNAFLISPLLDLKASEAGSVMERAFAANRVDESVPGDWEDAQIELGLKTQRERPRKPNNLTVMGEKFRAAWTGAGLTLPKCEAMFPKQEPVPISIPASRKQKVGRNEPCPCGSGKKYKKCCGR